MSESTTTTTGKRRGRPPGYNAKDATFLAWRKASQAAEDPIADVEARVEEFRTNLMHGVERAAQLAKIDAAAALARFQVYGGKVKDGLPVDDEGNPYIPAAER